MALALRVNNTRTAIVFQGSDFVLQIRCADEETLAPQNFANTTTKLFLPLVAGGSFSLDGTVVGNVNAGLLSFTLSAAQILLLTKTLVTGFRQIVLVPGILEITNTGPGTKIYVTSPDLLDVR